MSLLGTSPDCAFSREYPYETRELGVLTANGPVGEKQWRDFQDRWFELAPGARYYAEKAVQIDLQDLSGIPLRLLHLARDPRDAWVSTLAFDAKRGFQGFGTRSHATRQDYRQEFVRRTLCRFERTCRERQEHEANQLHYEDLVLRGEATAARLGSWLGIELDIRRVPEHAQHRTTTHAAASVGRWRTELPAEEGSEISEQLAPVLSALGYDLS